MLYILLAMVGAVILWPLIRMAVNKQCPRCRMHSQERHPLLALRFGPTREIDLPDIYAIRYNGKRTIARIARARRTNRRQMPNLPGNARWRNRYRLAAARSDG